MEFEHMSYLCSFESLIGGTTCYFFCVQKRKEALVSFMYLHACVCVCVWAYRICIACVSWGLFVLLL